MAYSDYTTNLFGTKDMGVYSPPANTVAYEFTARNRPDVIKKDSSGRITAADYITSYTLMSAGGGNRISSRNIEFQCRVEGTTACAIFAMPKIFGNAPHTAKDDYYAGYQGFINNFWEMESFNYYLISLGTVNLYYDNVDGNMRIFQRQANNVVEYIPPAIYGFLPEGRDSDLTLSTGSTPNPGVSRPVLYTLNQLVDRLNLANSDNPQLGTKYNAGTQQFGRFKDDDIARLVALNTAWAARTDSIYNNVRQVRLPIQDDMEKPERNPIGATIATGFPIFTLDSYEQMIRYFQGQEYVSDNDNTPPPEDWSTDWDIYVRGANKPNIFVTMKSVKVDEWLNSTENESGIEKGDITVHYRYQAVDNLDTSGKVTEKTVTFKKDKYDNTLYTSYIELIGLEFDNFVPDSLDELMGLYASLEFRLEYLKYNSTWCYFSVGVIGSPSIPDFSYMKNSWGQRNYGFNDSSTVTIHYDIYPPGYDPYPTPEKPSTPSIIGGDTLPTTPTDTAAGMGLLTTTYLLTAAQCDELGAFMWNFDLFDKIKALNTSPLDNIVSIKIMPYAVTGTPREIVIGNVSTNINADKVGALPLYKVGDLEYKGRYENFLDRGGDTTAHLFLPFIGFVPIDPAWFTDKKLTVYYAFDVVTGTCRAIIAVDNIAVANYTAVCGVDIPLAMGVRSQIEASFATASMGLLLAPFAPTVSGAAIVGGVASSLMTDNASQRTGGVSPITAQYETRMCYIVIESVNANYPRSMKHNKGLPCNATYSLSQLSGFTQVDESVDLSGIGGATDSEKEEIRRLLAEGVYL